MKKSLFLAFVFYCWGLVLSAQPAKLIGEWQLTQVVENDQTHENLEAIFIFEKGGVLKTARSAKTEAVEVGTWEYKEKQNVIQMHSALDKDFNGTATLVKISRTELIYTKDEAELHFSRYTALRDIPESVINNGKSDLVRLKFNEADFFDANGDYKYFDDEAKLPWQDIDEKLMTLVNVEQLVYKCATLDEDENILVDKVLRANVNSIPAELSLSIDYIFYGFDRDNLPEDTELPVSTDYSGLLFPEEDNSFRVSGLEEITTLAGTYNCTVVEVVGSFETCKKLWMINDMPGVYAKIISDKPGPFGQYSIYELQEIKMKE